MPNKMATMQGCCCSTQTFLRCSSSFDPFLVWWSTILTSATITIPTVANTGGTCPNCASNLQGTFILNTRTALLNSCNFFCVGDSFTNTSTGYPCGSPSVGMYTLSMNCSGATALLYLHIGVGGGCVTYASRSFTFPFTDTDFKSGVLTPVSATPTAVSPYCTFSGNIPYVLA